MSMSLEEIKEDGKEWEVDSKEKYELEFEVQLWEEGKYVIS